MRTSRLQRLGARQPTFKALLPAMPAAAERLPVAGHDLVISSSSAFAHGVTPDEDAVHVCYCYTPFRYAWYEQEAGVMQAPRAARPLVRRMLRAHPALGLRAGAARHALRRDLAAVAGAHPALLGRRRRRSSIRPSSCTLRAGAIRASTCCSSASWFATSRSRWRSRPPARHGCRSRSSAAAPTSARLRALSGSSAEFLGRVDDEQLAALYASCRALIVPNVEEFGITAVEAQASGRPVIAADGGGARETVIEGETGYFFRRAMPPG